MKFAAMPMFWADFFADTEHMDDDAAKAYLFLLGHAWLRGAKLPADDLALSRLARVTPRKWAVIKAAVLTFFKLGDDGFLRNSRLTREHDYVTEKVSKNRENGRKGGRPAAAISNQTVGDNPQKSPTVGLNTSDEKPNEINEAKKADGSVSVKQPTPTPTIRERTREVGTDSSGKIESSTNSSSSDDDDVFAWESKQAPAGKSKPKPPTRFDQFWAAYPRKVGKDAALKAFKRIAAAKRVTFDELMAGLERYKQNKPMKIDYCHPATWLNEGRWADEYSAPRLVTANGKPVDTYLYDPSGFMRTA
jgi:uncharacterized protein YdaU (DUF1376 family)